ncbi:MAG: hypothetical protein QXZ20_01955 [Candidatus Aenigmatarchaeota archaeon]
MKFRYKVILFLFFLISIFYFKKIQEEKIFKKIIERLTATSRVAEVVVTKTNYDPKTKKTYTTIKFLEYDTTLVPLEPRYFTFSNNIIQFQALVIRFDDFYIKRAHPLKGKSAYIFMKVFSLTKEGLEAYDINNIKEVPSGYRIFKTKNNFEKKLWEKFWDYALNPKKRTKIGAKNLQIEAPGTKFLPGFRYIIKIEHIGGLRIDVEPLETTLRKN